jgi:hypothetical protein
MIALRASQERGHADHGWLDSRHTFSFADYYDPRHMGYRALRVINEDRVAPGMGFGAHPHRDMEIISYVVDGALEHRDSMGNGSVIRRGEVQRISAGTGMLHSEYNPSATEPVHFLQIWVVPSVRGVQPSYDQRYFSNDEKRNRLRLIVSPDGRDASISIYQDAAVYASLLEAGHTVEHALVPGRHAWVQVIRGAVDLNGQTLGAGDGAAVSDAGRLTVAAREESELLLFDLA